MTTRNQRRADKRERTAKMQRASAKLRIANARYDREAAAEMQAVGLAERVSCRRHCTGCCHQLVLSNYVEAVHLVLHHRALIEQAEPELSAQLAVLHELGIREADLMSRDRDVLAERYFARALPCPLLDRTTGDCRVYADRPHACRQHTLIGLDPAVCAPGAPNVEVGSYIPRALEPLIQAQLEAMLPLTGGDVVLGPLQAMLLSALDTLRKHGL